MILPGAEDFVINILSLAKVCREHEELFEITFARLALRKIKHGDYSQSPQQHRDLQRTVFEGHFIGRTCCMTNLDQLQITEDAIHDKWNCEHHRMVFWKIGRGKCVKRIGNDCHARHDGNVLIEKWNRISFKYFAM